MSRTSFRGGRRSDLVACFDAIGTQSLVISEMFLKHLPALLQCDRGSGSVHPDSWFTILPSEDDGDCFDFFLVGVVQRCEGPVFADTPSHGVRLAGQLLLMVLDAVFHLPLRRERFYLDLWWLSDADERHCDDVDGGGVHGGPIR